MKLTGRDAAAYFAKPDPKAAGLLLFGADTMRVAHRRGQVILALIGPEGAAEMRLTRIAAADLRRDPALLSDAMRATGFFPGARAVLVEEAGEPVAPIIAAALQDWQPGDAQIIVTAGALAAKSALRKLFEGAKGAYAAGIYDDPPSRAEIEVALKSAGLGAISGPAMADLMALATALGPGDFRQTLEKIGLYKLGDPAALTSEEVAALAPASIDAAIDDAIHAVAETRSGEIGPVLARLRAQGAQPVTLCISAQRHFRALYAAAADPGGPGAGIARLRPPIFGPRRDRMQRQASSWGAARLEQALEVLVDADLTLRSSQKGPQMAILERALIRIAGLGAS